MDVLDNAVAQLCALDVEALPVEELQRLVLALQTGVNRLTGLRDQALGTLQARSGGSVVLPRDPEADPDAAARTQDVRGWWRDRTTITGQQAGADVRHAEALRELPLLAGAVTDGRLSPAHAKALVRLHGKIALEDLQASQEQLILLAAPLPPDALHRWVSHQIATHCEPALEAEQDAARAKRYLQLSSRPDGTVRGRFVLTAEDAETVFTVLEPLARRQGLEDGRSAGQRRADALTDVFAGAAAWMDLPTAGGQRPQVTYVMTQSWAAGEAAPSLLEQLGCPEPCGTVHPHAAHAHTATGAWTGPQTRTRMETVLCDARLSRLLLDPLGTIVSLEALNDEITLAQRRAVSARDRHCVARGCTRPPAFCDVHHLRHRADGGGTSTDNLVQR